MKVISDWHCEIHESDFNNGFVKYMKVISTLVFFCEIHESDFNNVFVKYMKVISAMVL
jgi:hypothetical protein